MADRKKKPFAISAYRVKINLGSTADTRYWQSLTGVKKTWNTREYSDGQTNIKLKLPTTVQYDDVTLSKPFTEDDADIYNKLLAVNASQDYVDIFVQPVNGDGYSVTNIGGVIVVKYCSVLSATILDNIDTIGDDVQQMKIVLSPGQITSTGAIQWWNEPANLGATQLTAV